MSVVETVEALRKQVRACGFSFPLRIAALSFGGMVASQWCQGYPDEVAAAVLINTSMRPFCAFYRRLNLRVVPWLLVGFMSSGNLRERVLLNITSNLRREDPRILDSWQSIAKQRPVSVLNALRQLCAAASFRAGMRTPSVPMLILCSEHDRLVHSRCSHVIARRWNCPIEIHPSAGHDLPLDDPDWVIEKITQWTTNVLPAQIPEKALRGAR